MADRLRLVRNSSGAYPLPPGAAEPDRQLHQQLTGALRRYLSPAIASVFAEPVRTADGRHVDWFTTLTGQPTPLAALPVERRARVRRLLDERIGAIRALTLRLPELEPGTGLDRLLRQAVTYPSEDVLYAVDGQPVITFWGYGEVPPDRLAPVPGPARRWWLGWRPWAVLAGLLLLAAALWWFVRSPLAARLFDRTDYAQILASERADAERLRGELLDRRKALARALNTCALHSESALRTGRLGELQSELRHALDWCAARAESDGLTKERAVLADRLQALRAALADKAAQCRERAADDARAERRRLLARLAALRKQLQKALKRCNEPKTPPRPDLPKPPPRKPEPAAVPPKPKPPEPKPAPKPEPTPAPAPEKKASALPPCPGERPPEDAPDFAVVLDASGSMRIPAELDGQSARVVAEFERCMAGAGLLGPMMCAHLFPAYEALMTSGRGPSRLESAKQAVAKVVRSLPDDVDVGLAVLEDCPRATDFGLFPAARRNQLLQTVRALSPRQGTPLADGLRQAARKVDGVRAPAVMVVVSDGKDSCGGNPCAAAAALKAAKPKLKINVVDIVGDGAVNCIAQATGGDVLTPRSGMNLDQLVKRAARDAEKPEHCK